MGKDQPVGALIQGSSGGCVWVFVLAVWLALVWLALVWCGWFLEMACRFGWEVSSLVEGWELSQVSCVMLCGSTRKWRRAGFQETKLRWEVFITLWMSLEALLEMAGGDLPACCSSLQRGNLVVAPHSIHYRARKWGAFKGCSGFSPTKEVLSQVMEASVSILKYTWNSHTPPFLLSVPEGVDPSLGKGKPETFFSLRS